jgi:EmrB/QacA subfamily drug resistance transporter
VYVLAVVMFTAGSALCGLAASSTQLIVFRVLQGFGGGMILPIGQLMLADAAGPQRMGQVMSIAAIPSMLAPILGPTIGGLIIANASWRWIFYVNVPIGLIAAVAAVRMLPRDAPTPAGRLDVRGLALMASGLPLVIYGLDQLASRGSFTAPQVLGPVTAGAVLGGLFVRHALRSPNPLLNLRLFRCGRFASASSAMLCLGAVLFGGMILLPLYWQEVAMRARLRRVS